MTDENYEGCRANFLKTCAVLLAAGALSAAAGAQDLAAERTLVLTQTGTVQELDLPLYPLAPELGLTYSQEVGVPSALSLRLHLTVLEDPGPRGTWGIRIFTDEQSWSLGGDEVSDFGVWSDEIEGDQVKIEVYSARPSNPARLVIDKVAVRRQPIAPLSITGPNQLRPIAGQPGWVIDQGRSVARVRFVGDNGKLYVCTAFLVTSELMLTNQHCISSASEMRSALIDFDYDREGVKPLTLRLSRLVETDAALDYALVRLSRPVDRSPLRLETNHPPEGEQLLILQHPAGEPKQVSVADCKVDGALVAGRLGKLTDFGHQCDTKGGSSGSPVVRFDTRTVVGLHHLGIAQGSSDVFNRAVHIDGILADLPAAVRTEIEAGQTGR